MEKMSYRTILVNLNEILHARHLLETTASIARKADAHVIGLYAIPAVDLYISSEVDVLPVEDDRQRLLFEKHEAAIRSAFDSVILKEGIRGEFRVVDAPEPRIASTVVEHAREADLVVIGQSSSASNRAIGSGFSERVVIASGRPTLVVPPPNGRAVVPNNLAIVGWNGSRESTRAVFDSIPLLKQCDEILLARVGPEPEGDANSSASAAGVRLAKTLARHDIDARAIDLHASREAGEVLLERAESRCASLLVMGAYGHTRLREFILGGATRSVLKGMKCPVLFSH